MKILQKIKSSIYNPEFYKIEKDGSFKSALGYFTKLLLIQAFIVTVVFSVLFIPFTLKLLSSESTAKAAQAFPADLVATLKNGQLSTNVTEPYMVPFSKEVIEKEKNNIKNPLPQYSLIIDTKSPFSLDLINSNKTNFLLTKENIVAKDSRGKITIQPLKDFPDIEISRTKIDGWISSAEPYFKYVIPVSVILIYTFMFIGSFMSGLLLIAILSFAIWVTLKIQKKPMAYKQIFKLGFYAITSVVLVNIILTILGIGSMILVSTVVFIVMFFVNTNEKKTEVAAL